jgi:hypothetical protein
MIIIKPVMFSDANLSGFNVPEPDGVSEWVSGASYAVDDVVSRSVAGVHARYQALAAVSGTTPPENDKDNWVYLRRTNRWSMFPYGVPGSDGILRDQISEQTTNADTITFDFTPGQVVDSLSFFNLSAQSVRVVVDDPTDGVVYDETISLNDSAPVSNWYEYFFTPIQRKSSLVLTDLPPYGSATITVTIDNTGGTAACGLFSAGAKTQIGTTNYGSRGGIVDYSRKEVNTFGQYVIVQRQVSRERNFDVTIPRGTEAQAERLLEELRTTACTFIGDAEDEFTSIYGFYRDFEIILPGPMWSDATIEILGLS